MGYSYAGTPTSPDILVVEVNAMSSVRSMIQQTGFLERLSRRHTGALANDNDPFAVRECFLSGTEPTPTQTADLPGSPDDFYQSPR